QWLARGAHAAEPPPRLSRPRPATWHERLRRGRALGAAPAGAVRRCGGRRRSDRARRPGPAAPLRRDLPRLACARDSGTELEAAVALLSQVGGARRDPR